MALDTLSMGELLSSWPFSIKEESHPEIADLLVKWWEAAEALALSSPEARDRARARALFAKSVETASSLGLSTPFDQASPWLLEPGETGSQTPHTASAIFRMFSPEREKPKKQHDSLLAAAKKIAEAAERRSLSAPAQWRTDKMELEEGLLDIAQTHGFSDIRPGGERFLPKGAVKGMLRDVDSMLSAAASSLGVSKKSMGLDGRLCLRVQNPFVSPSSHGEFKIGPSGVRGGSLDIGLRKLTPAGDMAACHSFVVAHEWIHALDALAFDRLCEKSMDKIEWPAGNRAMFSKTMQSVREKWPHGDSLYRGAVACALGGGKGTSFHQAKRIFNLVLAGIPADKRTSSTPEKSEIISFADALSIASDAAESGLETWPGPSAVSMVRSMFPKASEKEAARAVSSDSFLEILRERASTTVPGIDAIFDHHMIRASAASITPLYLRSPSEVFARLFAHPERASTIVSDAVSVPEESSCARFDPAAMAAFRRFAEACGVETVEPKPLPAFSMMVASAASSLARRASILAEESAKEFRPKRAAAARL